VAGELRQLPNQITCGRIVLTGVLHLIVLTESRTWFLALYAVAFLSDVLDGYLARRMALESYFGMRLDSFADYFLMASSVWWAWRLRPELFVENAAVWWSIACMLALPQAIALLRLGRNAGFHLYSTKIAGWLAFALFVHAVVAGYSVFLLYAFAAAAVIKSLEETAICLTVADPYAAPRPSFFSYVKRRT
jgi:CDP-diacylglycerol--glycerol-3-phosphate 3-phosphatidyltransferase